MISEKLWAEFDVNLLAATCSPSLFRVEAVDDWSEILRSLPETSSMCSRGSHGIFPREACFAEVSSSLACLWVISISLGRLPVKTIIISMKTSLLLALLLSFGINWKLSVDLFRTSKMASAKLGLIPTVDREQSKICKVSTNEKQSRIFCGSWTQIHIGLIGIGQKNCALVYSIDSSFLELLFTR